MGGQVVLVAVYDDETQAPKAIGHLHQAIVDGHFVLLLRGVKGELSPWLEVLHQIDAKEILELPYKSVAEVL